MNDEFQDLQRLLRLKRHEAPPPEYFEDFLCEFHRRQRAELLRRPLWRLALDRLEGALPTFSPARTAYAGGFAAVLGAAVMVSGSYLRTRADAPQSAPLAVATVPLQTLTRVSSSPAFSLHASHNSRLPEVDFDQPRTTAAVTYVSRGARPRYVLDTQPVSYEPSSSF